MQAGCSAAADGEDEALCSEMAGVKMRKNFEIIASCQIVAVQVCPGQGREKSKGPLG